MFNEQIPVFQEDMSVRRTILFFQEPFSCVHWTDTDFPRALFLTTEQIAIFQNHLFWLPNRYRFSRSTFLATEQIPIFQELLFLAPNRYLFSRNTFFGYRTDTPFLPNEYRFSGTLFLATEQITIFQKAFFEYQRTYPPPNRYFSNRSRWLLFVLAGMIATI